jgi:adiponectin receptor
MRAAARARPAPMPPSAPGASGAAPGAAPGALPSPRAAPRRRRASLAKAGGVGAAAAGAGAAAAAAGALYATALEAPEWTLIPFIERGYRVRHSFARAAASLFASHQDTLNIWTHALGLAWFVRMTPYTLAVLARNGAPPRDVVLFLLFLAGAQFQMASSAAYHVFRCVSARAEALFLRVDIAGIVAMIAGSWALAMGQGFHCAPLTGAAYLAAECLILFCAARLGAAAVARPALYGAYYAAAFSAVAFGGLPFLHALRACASPACRAVLLQAHVGMFGNYALGFFFFVTRFPERAVPRVFDVVGHSHSLWHAFVFLAGRAWLLGMLDFNTLKAEEGHGVGCALRVEDPEAAAQALAAIAALRDAVLAKLAK